MRERIGASAIACAVKTARQRKLKCASNGIQIKRLNHCQDWRHPHKERSPFQLPTLCRAVFTVQNPPSRFLRDSSCQKSYAAHGAVSHRWPPFRARKGLLKDSFSPFPLHWRARRWNHARNGVETSRRATPSRSAGQLRCGQCAAAQHTFCESFLPSERQMRLAP